MQLIRNCDSKDTEFLFSSLHYLLHTDFSFHQFCDYPCHWLPIIQELFIVSPIASIKLIFSRIQLNSTLPRAARNLHSHSRSEWRTCEPDCTQTCYGQWRKERDRLQSIGRCCMKRGRGRNASWKKDHHGRLVPSIIRLICQQQTHLHSGMRQWFRYRKVLKPSLSTLIPACYLAILCVFSHLSLTVCRTP